MEQIILANAGAWAWKEFGKGFKNWAVKFIGKKYKEAKSRSEKLQEFEARWVNFQWDKAVKQYQDKMRRDYGYIRILGSTEPISLGDLFTDVHILETPSAFRRFDITNLHQIQEEPEKLVDSDRIPGLRIVVQKRGHRLFILGKPGAGKTTFMKYLVHQTMVSGLDKIPIFITLKDWADSNLALVDFIAREFEICKFPQAWEFIQYVLESGRVVLLFDGLDEVREESFQRQRTITAVRDFCRQYERSQAIITCRVAASDYSFEQFTYVEMADFDDDQVRIYVYKWFQSKIDLARQFLNELAKDENSGIQDLGRSPLLLSMICLAYSETLRIPHRRVELYEEALDALLKKWDASRAIRRDEVYRALSLGRKRQMFTRIATESFAKGQIFFAKRELINKINDFIQNLPPTDAIGNSEPDGESVLQAIAAHHGIFVERANGIYSFGHLTFQEYYAARYITENFNHGALKDLARRISDSRWREVFLLTASLLAEADEFLEEILVTTSTMLENDAMVRDIQRQIIKTVPIVSIYQPAAVRAAYWLYYLVLVLDVSHSVANERNLSLDISHYFVDVIDHEFNLAFGVTSTLNLARALAFGHDLAEDFSRILANEKEKLELIEKANNNDTHHIAKLVLDSSLTNFLLMISILIRVKEETRHSLYENVSIYFKMLLKYAKNSSPVFANSIPALPKLTASTNIWQRYERNMRIVSIDYLDFSHQGKFSANKCQYLNQYFRAVQLLVDCINMAYVSDRQSILSQVLALP